MTHITVSSDQVRQIEGATFPIVFVDESGRTILEATQSNTGEPKLPPDMTEEQWAEIVQRFENPGTYSTLEEIKARHGWWG